MFWKKKYAIVETEASGTWIPVVVTAGSLWGLLLDLKRWYDDRPTYAGRFSFFSYIEGCAYLDWDWNEPRKSGTMRRIVRIGDEMEERPLTEHLMPRWL